METPLGFTLSSACFNVGRLSFPATQFLPCEPMGVKLVLTTEFREVPLYIWVITVNPFKNRGFSNWFVVTKNMFSQGYPMMGPSYPPVSRIALAASFIVEPSVTMSSTK